MSRLRLAQGDKLSFVIDVTGTVGLKVTAYPTLVSLRERGPGLDLDLSFDEMREIAYADRLAAGQDTEV
jgi:hypothetical protein